MVEFLVSSLLEQFTSITVQEAEQEIRLVVGVDEEVRKLEGNLQIIQAVLDDAEKRQLKEEAVKLWLKRLKDVSYEIDNVLDEWNTAMIKSKIEKQEKAESSPILKKKIRSFIPSSSCFSRQFKKLSLRHDIAHKIKELSENLDELFKERVRYGFELNKGAKAVERPTTSSLVDVSDIVGRDKDRDDLIRKLLGEGSGREKNPYVISLVGMGGIGKTSLAQLAYNDDEVKDHFEIRMWVCVSEPFDRCRVAQAIIQEVERASPKCERSSSNITEFGTLLQIVQSLIEGKKFFLILDDVWTEEIKEWEPFKLVLKFGAQGSKILVTTRNEKVAKMVNSAFVTNLGKLREHCWLIINKLAFHGMDVNQCEQLEDVGRELANKCKGLPLAAKTLGSLMCDKRSSQQWKNILDNNLWEFEDVQKGLLAPLLLSYYELPSAIKRCFLYCAVFPKDYVFSRNNLVYLWMAQGYLDLKQNIEMEIIGEEYFEKLVMRSLFQDFEKDNNDDDKIIRCKMHDMVHDFALSMTTNECLTIDVDKVLGIEWKSAHHLTLELKKDTQFPVSIYNAKNLRTLFFRNSSMFFPLDLFQHLTCLRSLNLEYISLEKLPNEVEKLKHLRLLNLSWNSKITELPEMMCSLCNLQTLDISYCYQIKRLPQGMGKLIKLRHLRIDDCYELTVPFPKGIGRLSDLRTLKKFIIGGTNNIGECKLGDLKNLVHLKGSLNIEGLENVTDVQEAENAQLKKKIHFRELSLRFGVEAENRRGENDELVLNALEPHPELESLWICGYGGTGYPNWVMSLTILKKLELESWDKLEQLPPLGKLRFLESLHIWSSKSMKKVGVEFLGIESNRKKDEEKGSTSTSSLSLFPNLKSLCFWKMEKWEEWDGMGESGVSESVLIMPRLQVLTIGKCPKLKSLPNFLEKTSLEELVVDCGISNWMTLATLSGLKTLRLNLNNDVEQLPPLGKMLLVESLEIWSAHRVKKVGVEFLGIEEESNNNKKIDDEKGSTSSSSSSLVLFPNLKSLEFWSMEEWEEWDGIGGTMREEEAQESGVTITIMPRLQSLTIDECPKLKSLPDFLPTTPLKKLMIIRSPILSERCKTEIGDQWPKISHIPNIEINGTYVRRDGRPMQT